METGSTATQAVEAGEVEADQAGVPVAARGQAARHAGAAAEGHDRDVVLDRHGQDRHDLVVAAGPDDGVGSVVEVAGAGAEQVGGRLAARTQAAYVVVEEHVVVADRAPQRRRARPAGERARAGRRRPARLRSAGPNTASTSARAPSGSGAAAAGSPQRWGCISRVMRYSVTCDVTS